MLSDHAKNFNLNQVSRVHYLARVLNAFGPAHFRHMDQTFNAALKLDEGAVIRQRWQPYRSLVRPETFLDAGPRIGRSCL